MRRTNPLATSTKVLWILSPGRGPSFGSRLGIKHIAAAVAPRRQPAAPRARLAGIVVGTASAWLLHLASTRASGADVDVSEPREGRRSGVRRSEIVPCNGVVDGQGQNHVRAPTSKARPSEENSV